MKRFIAYIAVFAAFAAVSCTRSEMDFKQMDSSMLSISLNVGEMATRASALPAVEDVVTQFDWFFYADATGTSAPVFHGHFDVNGTTLTPSGTNTPSSSTADADGTIHLGFDLRSNTYKSMGVSYSVYILANYPGINHGTASELTLQKLLAKTMETNFDEMSKNYSAISGFVMDSYSGDDEATYPQLVPLQSAVADATNNTQARLAVNLRRVAAKITFTLNISAQVDDPQNATAAAADKTYWRPLTNSTNFNAYMVNMISYATMQGAPQSAETMAPTFINGNTGITGGHQISYATSHVKTATDTHEPPLKWELDPFYTYPVSFESDSNNAPYLKIALPWENVDANGNLTNKGATLYYYKVHLVDKTTKKPLTSFDRNKHYIVTLNVDTIGGTQEDYVTLDTYYYLADWQIPADGTYTGYRAPRFLDIARPVYYIYGDNELTVAVTSSHNITAVITDVSQTTIMGGVKMKTADLTALNASTERKPEVTTDGKISFKLHYDLDTTLDMTDGASDLPSIYGQMDLSPIYWTVKVSHTDDANYTKTVTIVQYPSIYGEMNHTDNWDSRFVNGKNGSGPRYSDNGTWIDGASTDVWNNGGSSSSNSNPALSYPTYLGGVEVYADKSWNKTVLSISTLSSFLSSSETEYNWVLGDPRVKLKDSGLYSTPVNGTTWAKEDLGPAPDYLDNYLVPDIHKGNYIAPKIMITSGLAACTNYDRMHWKNAAQRCASYQEDGYPAGRWRLPTEAEIEFVIQLENKANSANGNQNYLDPNNMIFHPTHSYWASTGRYYYGADKTFTEAPTADLVKVASIRCVYDLWYWGDDPVVTPDTQWSGFMLN